MAGLGDTMAGSGDMAAGMEGTLLAGGYTLSGSGDMLVVLEGNVQAGLGGTPAQLTADMPLIYTESHHLQAASCGLGETHCQQGQSAPTTPTAYAKPQQDMSITPN